jgi:uncharacterized membrane-anchored protein
MGMLLAFAPFVAFVALDRLVGPTPGLMTAAFVSAVLIARDSLTPGRSPKILEIGTALLFGALATYAVLNKPTWSVIGVRLCVDIGLLTIVLLTMVAGRPFTLQYARDQVPADRAASPAFIRMNYVITGAWALAFAVMVSAELALLYVPAMPHRLGIVVIVAAIVGAIKFSDWYPSHSAGRSVTKRVAS